MPNTYHDAIINLKNAYHEMAWYQKLFFPYQLARELESYPEQNATKVKQFAMFKKFEKNTWLFQRWLFSSLQLFYDNEYTKEFLYLNKKTC